MRKFQFLILIFAFILCFSNISYAKTKTLTANGQEVPVKFKKAKEKTVLFTADKNGYIELHFRYETKNEISKENNNISVEFINIDEKSSNIKDISLSNKDPFCTFDVEEKKEYEIKITFPEAKKGDIIYINSSEILEGNSEGADTINDIVSVIKGKIGILNKGIGEKIYNKINDYGSIYMLMIFIALIVFGFILKLVLLKYGISFLTDPLYRFKSAIPGGHPIDFIILISGLLSLGGVILGRMNLYNNEIIGIIVGMILPFISIYLCSNKTDEGHLITLIGAKISGIILIAEFFIYIALIVLTAFQIFIKLGISIPGLPGQ